MTRRITKCIGAITLYSVFSVCLAAAQDETMTTLNPNQQTILGIAEETHKRIVMLTEYGVFDHIHFAIKGTDTVVLQGYASRPILKSSAEGVVQKIEGVSSVDNQIQVLPLSPNDDQIRAAVYASIYGFPALQRYTSNRGGPRSRSIARTAGGITNDPPIGYHAIHIIVKNGNVTLMGVVDNDSDLAMAGVRANIVPGVFSVDNSLEIASQK